LYAKRVSFYLHLDAANFKSLNLIRARSSKAARSYYLPARWLYTHLNRSDYVSWFSDVRRRPTPIGRRARAHYTACARAPRSRFPLKRPESPNASAMASYGICHHPPECLLVRHESRFSRALVLQLTYHCLRISR